MESHHTGQARSVRVARGFRRRLIGLGRNPRDGAALAFRSKSVHTFFVGRTISVAALDETGRVIDSGSLAPNRIYVRREAVSIAEWVGMPPPPVDTRVELLG